jgi:hypothetical protein
VCVCVCVCFVRGSEGEREECVSIWFVGVGEVVGVSLGVGVVGL